MAIAADEWIIEIDIAAGSATKPLSICYGTEERNPEGSYVYKKDDYCCLRV
jgi:hypothetical protein